jgi:DNA polymerase-1
MAYQSFFAKTPIVNVAPQGGATGATEATESPPVLSKPHVDTQSAQPYALIVNLAAARTALTLLTGQQVAFDLETTGLDPLSDRVRLLSVAPLSGGKPIVFDLFSIGGAQLLREELKQLSGIAHNADFDLAFLTRAGAPLGLTDCTKIAAHIAGSKTGSLDLATVAGKYLGREVDKTLQLSDWTGHLSDKQIAYAAKDADLVRDLWFILQDRIRRQGSEQVYEIVRDALPAVVQMHLNGVPFNKAAHASIVEELQTELDLIRPKLIAALGGRKPSGNDLQAFLTEGLGGRDADNYNQWPRTKSGKQLSTARDDLSEYLCLLEVTYQGIARDFLLPLLEIESVTKTFGTKLVDQLHAVTGRLTPNFSLTGTATGRLSSSAPNIQGFPRRAAFRETIAVPAGRMLVIADYNAMELRVAAQIAGETTLIEGFKAGEDPHRLTAALLLKKPPEQVTKDERQLAKAVNFGLLFGQGPKGLSAYAQKTYGVKMTIEEADAYRKAWFAVYPAIQTWQRQHDRQCSSTLSVRTPSGRVRRWTNHVWGTYGGYKSTEAYNTPIQGGAAECILVAMARLVSVLGTQALDAALVASVHDELIVECREHDADAVIGILEEAMTFGFATIFPYAPTNGLVEARKVKTWAKE